MNASQWYASYRQQWILETIRVFGYLNREHICRKFGVSVPQASLDLRRVLKDYPGLIKYSRVTQRYEQCYELAKKPHRK